MCVCVCMGGWGGGAGGARYTQSIYMRGEDEIFDELSVAIGANVMSFGGPLLVHLIKARPSSLVLALMR